MTHYVKYVTSEVNDDGEYAPCNRVCIDGTLSLDDLLQIVAELTRRGERLSVEPETCSECVRGEVPMIDGNGNEIGMQSCPRCGGTGVISRRTGETGATLLIH